MIIISPKNRMIKFNVSFRIFHPTLDSRKIGEEIGLLPDVGWTAGKPRVSISGIPLGGIRKDSFACFNFDDLEFKAFNDNLVKIAQLVKENFIFIDKVMEEGGACDVYVSSIISESCGWTINPEIMQIFGQHGIELHFGLTY